MLFAKKCEADVDVKIDLEAVFKAGLGVVWRLVWGLVWGLENIGLGNFKVLLKNLRFG